MKSRDLLVKRLASNFSKEFTKLAPEFELPDRIVFTECLIELLAIRNLTKANESRYKKIYRSTKFKKFSIAATQQLLSYFEREYVLMHRGVSETDEYLVSHVEFEAMPSAEEQTLSEKEFAYMCWAINNGLNADLVNFRTELHKEARKAVRAAAYQNDETPSFYKRNKTKIFAFIYFYLHKSKEEPIFEKFELGKVEATKKLAKANDFSAKHFRTNYYIIIKKGYNIVSIENKNFIKCAIHWLSKNEYPIARQLAENDYHNIIKNG